MDKEGHSFSRIFSSEEELWILKYYKTTCRALYGSNNSSFSNQASTITATSSNQTILLNSSTDSNRTNDSIYIPSSSFHIPINNTLQQQRSIESYQTFDTSCSYSSAPNSSSTTTTTTTTSTNSDSSQNFQNFEENVEYTKQCTQCLTRTSPNWRKGMNGCVLCNKCGLKWRRHMEKLAKTQSFSE